MKSLSILSLFLLQSLCAYSQDGAVGIGTNTVVSEHAILEIKSDKKGLLIPRMNTSNRLLIEVAFTAEENGLLVYDTDINTLFYHNGSGWHQVGTPPGTIVMWSGTDIPPGWALCNGNWYNPNDNTDSGPASIGKRTVLTPNLSGRFVVGLHDEDFDYNAIGKSGGEKKHTLTTNEIPAHNHPIPSHRHPINMSTQSAGTHHHEIFTRLGNSDGSASSAVRRTTSGTAGGNSVYYDTESAGAHTHTINGYTGYWNGTSGNNSQGGEAHENRPPYYVLAYIMKL